jgi:hypothetical protein
LEPGPAVLRKFFLQKMVQAFGGVSGQGIGHLSKMIVLFAYVSRENAVPRPRKSPACSQFGLTKRFTRLEECDSILVPSMDRLLECNSLHGAKDTDE